METIEDYDREYLPALLRRADLFLSYEVQISISSNSGNNQSGYIDTFTIATSKLDNEDSLLEFADALDKYIEEVTSRASEERKIEKIEMKTRWGNILQSPYYSDVRIDYIPPQIRQIFEQRNIEMKPFPERFSAGVSAELYQLQTTLRPSRGKPVLTVV